MPGPATSQPTTSQPTAIDDGLKLMFATARRRNIDPNADGTDVPAMVVGANQFAIDVYRNVGAANHGNVVVGPYSIVTALGLIYAGAAGTTADEMAKVLHTGMPADRWHRALNAYDLSLDARTAGSPTKWAVANKVWVQQGLTLLPSFLDRLVSDYGAPVAEADFATDAEKERATINRWVERSTNDLIPELFPTGSIDSSTALALVNAVALDAPWEFPFDPRNTSNGEFQRGDGSAVMVPMMRYDEFLPSGSGDGYQTVEIPYGGGALSMVIIVPQNLAAFEAKLDAKRFAVVIGGISEGGIHLSMPRWSSRTHSNLNDILSALGMPSAFGAADFSGMTGARLALSTVEHEAFIEVDEKGTRAAAATGGAMVASHGATVSVDRPFLYVVRDRGSGIVLFIGRVTDPSAGP